MSSEAPYPPTHSARPRPLAEAGAGHLPGGRAREPVGYQSLPRDHFPPTITIIKSSIICTIKPVFCSAMWL